MTKSCVPGENTKHWERAPVSVAFIIGKERKYRGREETSQKHLNTMPYRHQYELMIFKEKLRFFGSTFNRFDNDV